MTKNLGAVLALVGAFALGAIAGSFGTRGFMLHRFGERLHGPPGRARMQFHVEALARRLDLTADQKARVQQILDAHEPERQAVFDRCAPEQLALKRKVDGEIRALLDPSQQQKFDAIERDHEGHPPP